MRSTHKSERLYHLLVEHISGLGDGERFPTLRQIMKSYGVSQFTASPALKRLQENGLISSRVGSGTIITRNRRPRKGARILYLRPDWDSRSIDAMEQAMTREIVKRGYRSAALRYDIEVDIYNRLPELEADAVILDPIRFDAFTTEQLQALTGSVRPVVLCRSTLPVFNIKCVGSHLMETGMLAANFLYRKGHRRIGILFSEAHSYTMDTMTETMKLCARTLGCEIEVFDAAIRKGIDSRTQTAEYLQRTFPGGKSSCSALFVCSYATAKVTLDYFSGHGVKVPQELSLMSFGFDSEAGVEPFLSSVHAPLDKQAGAALDIIDHQLSGDFSFPGQINITPEILEYHSVADINEPINRKGMEHEKHEIHVD